MELELTRIFVKVAQNGSFSKAALLLKITKSTASKAVTRLEKATGTKLMLRTTRSLTLTAGGRAFYEASLGPIQLLEEAQKSLFGQDSILSGLVKITAPEDLGSFAIAPTIANLAKKNPALSFELVYTDEVVDLVKDGFDLAIRIGKLNESSFKFKKIGDVVLILVASPRYIKTHDKIRQPKDLESQDCISYSGSSLSARWNLKTKKGATTVPVKTRISSNQMTGLVKMAAAGAGVAFVPHYLCRADLERGSLVTVLPEWTSAPMNVSIVTPLAANSSARLKVTADALSKAVQTALADGNATDSVRQRAKS